MGNIVENIVGEGEIARYEQFLLFPRCFQKACFQGASKGVIVWEWVNSLSNDKILNWCILKALAGKNKMIVENKFVLRKVENTMGKGENARCFHKVSC